MELANENNQPYQFANNIVLIFFCHLFLQSVIESIFETDDTITRHHLARLINIIATESAGRAYLLCQTEDAGNSNSAQVILKTLVEFLMDEAKGDSVYKQNLIGALQKLSLRRYAQSALIQMEIVPTLVDLLENIEGYQLSEYTVEYTSALLMNLVIRQAGKKACSDEQIGCKRILKLLCSLLRYENHEVRLRLELSK